MAAARQQIVLETLLAHLRPVQVRRRGAALGVWGEAGIGKSHITREVLRQAGLRGHVFPARTPLAELALHLPAPRTAGVWVQTQLDALRRGEGIGTARAVELLGTLLSRLAPVVLVLEDLHDADEAQRTEVAALAHTVLDTRGAALLVTGRQPFPEPISGLHLGPLDDASFRAVLEGDLRSPLPPEALDWLTTRARGHPLFGLESLRYLARQGHLWNDGQHWRWRSPPADWLPVTVETLIEAQLHAAAPTPARRAALDALALLPADLAPDVWAGMTALSTDELGAARAAAQEQGILTAGDPPTFSHPLYREVLQRAMPPGTREHLARAAVGALRTRDPLAAAALVPAAGLPPDVALDVLLEAAQRAEADGLRGRAGRLLASASAVAEGSRRARLALDAARALLRVDLPEAERLARVAEADPGCRPHARWTLAEVLASQGRLADAERLSDPDGAAGTPLDPARRLVLSMLARHIPQALAVWRDHPEVQRSPDVDVQLAGLRALVNTGALDEARTVLGALSARTDLSPVQRLTVETQDAVLHLQAGELETAAARLDTLAPRLLAAGEDRAAAIVRHNQGVALERLGRHAQAVTQENDAARHYAAAGDMRGFAAVRTAAAWNLWHFGRHAEAETVLLDAREVLRGGPPSIMLVECEGMLSLLYLDWSPPLAVELAQRSASSALDTARAIGDTSGSGACLYDLAMVRLRQGRWADALALAHELEALCEAHGFQGLAVNAQHARALALEGLGDAAGALALLRQAVLDNAAGSAMFTRRIETDVARLSGDRALARTLLAWYGERGLHDGTRRLRRLFPDLDGTASEPDPKPPHPAERPVLEVLGPMRVRQGEKVQAVRGARRREVLAHLLAGRLGGRSQVSRLELLDAVYPGQADAPASAALRDVIHHLRQRCGSGAILTTPDGYALGAIGSDAETFLATGDATLWRGAAWQDVEQDDALGDVRSVLHAALHARALDLLGTRPHEAERVGRVLLDGDPYDLEALRVLLQALRAGGRHATLSRTYARARARLREVDEHLPEAWSTFLTPPTSVS